MRIHIQGTMGKHFDRVRINTGIGWRELSPTASQKLRNHSPDGFAWGYGGSGPSQLALAVLLRATGDQDYALAHYQEFKRAVIQSLEFGKDFEIEVPLPAMHDLAHHRMRFMRTTEPCSCGLTAEQEAMQIAGGGK